METKRQLLHLNEFVQTFLVKQNDTVESVQAQVSIDALIGEAQRIVSALRALEVVAVDDSYVSQRTLNEFYSFFNTQDYDAKLNRWKSFSYSKKCQICSFYVAMFYIAANLKRIDLNRCYRFWTSHNGKPEKTPSSSAEDVQLLVQFLDKRFVYVIEKGPSGIWDAQKQMPGFVTTLIGN